MAELKYIKIRQHREFADAAAQWFNEKWGIPKSAYEKSIAQCLENKSAVPQWYAAVDDNKIIGGMGVIENDFHDKKELTPNVCGVYVDSAYRGNGICRKLLEMVCEDMNSFGIATLYLITDHTELYERYGWEFFCMAQGDGEDSLSRIYIHRK